MKIPRGGEAVARVNNNIVKKRGHEHSLHSFSSFSFPITTSDLCLCLCVPTFQHCPPNILLFANIFHRVENAWKERERERVKKRGEIIDIRRIFFTIARVSHRRRHSSPFIVEIIIHHSPLYNFRFRIKFTPGCLSG